MKSAISVFFNIDRTYMSILTPVDNNLRLDYVEATRNKIELDSLFDANEDAGVIELRNFIEKERNKINRVSVTIPAESVFVTQFPGSKVMTKEQLGKLVNLEIKQAYPQYNTDEFISNIIPLAKNKKGQEMMLASIMQKDIIETCKEIFKDFLPITNIEVSQMNAHSAFIFNYPELLEKNIMILGVQDQFIDVSVLVNSQPAYYSLLSFSDVDRNKLDSIIENEYNKIIANTVEHIDGIFLFGSGLTKKIFSTAQTVGAKIGIETNRLNAFRMVVPNVEERVQNYCKIMQHVFPPCVGAVIPSYHERIRLS